MSGDEKTLVLNDLAFVVLVVLAMLISSLLTWVGFEYWFIDQCKPPVEIKKE